MIRQIRGSTSQALAFISTLLAHSLDGEQALRWESVNLNDMVNEIAAGRRQPDGGPDIVGVDLLDVWADRLLLHQVLDNLIGNAVKYVAPGVFARVVVQTMRLDDGSVKVMVRDNGIGIPHPQREDVFNSFHRAIEGYPGTGLGLAICKRSIVRHGGTIHITDNPDGIGTCFEFTLPVSRAAVAVAH